MASQRLTAYPDWQHRKYKSTALFSKAFDLVNRDILFNKLVKWDGLVVL